MMSSRFWGVAPAALVLLALLGCKKGATEAEARQELEAERLTDLEVHQAGEGFEFSGKRDGEICTGTLTITKSGGSSTTHRTLNCRLDTSACKAGAAAVCVELADKLYNKEIKVFPTAAADLYRTACSDKSGRACDRVAEFEGIDKHWDKVREFATQACDLKYGAGCTRLGFLAYEGEGGEKDMGEALRRFKLGCELNDSQGCRAASGMMLDVEPADLKGSIELGERACKLNFEDSCLVLGLAIYRNKKDYKRAYELLSKACEDTSIEKNRGIACNLAGAIVADAMGGMKRDRARGVELFEASCEQDWVDGCTNAGNAYAKGRGVTADSEKSASLLAKACKLGNTKVCK